MGSWKKDISEQGQQLSVLDTFRKSTVKWQKSEAGENSVGKEKRTELKINGKWVWQKGEEAVGQDPMADVEIMLDGGS